MEKQEHLEQSEALHYNVQIFKQHYRKCCDIVCPQHTPCVSSRC